MSTIVISIIVPVYNVAEYLPECVRSILAIQSEHYEIILVDDGSVDGSGTLCDQFAEKNEKIVVIHKENGGLSSARNAGIRRAAGKYLLFVDADDFIKPKAVQRLIRLVSGAGRPQLVFLKARKLFRDGRMACLDERLDRKRIRGRSRNEVLKYLAQLKKYPGSACTKLVKRTLILKHNIFFAEGKLEEDLEWCMNVFLNAESFDYLDEDYYIYRQDRDGSITSHPSFQTERLISLIEFIIGSCRMAVEQEKETAECILAFLSYEYMIALLLYGRCRRMKLLKDAQKKKYSGFFAHYSFLTGCKKNAAVWLVRWCIRICGIEWTAGLLAYCYEWKNECSRLWPDRIHHTQKAGWNTDDRN